MNISFFLHILIPLLLTQPLQSDPVPAPPAGDYCYLRGLVFVEEIPGMGDYRVFVEEDEAFADMLIFESDNLAFLDGKGVWYFTDNRDAANFTITYEDIRFNADFAIAFTNFQSQAGCPQ